MKRFRGLLAGMAFLALPNSASAQEQCPAKHVCASDPESVVAALQASGYKALLTKDKLGDPMIESAASGYDFSVEFYGCEDGRGCNSLRFILYFADDGTNTPELANAWNKRKRFSQMAAQDDGGLSFSYDVTTLGGLNEANFADIVDWWQVMLSEVSVFFGEQSQGA